jgi:HNH endonuclease/NUMOD4 motif
MMATMTEWRAVVGYEGLYEVSDEGQVRSLDRQVWNGRGMRRVAGQVMVPSPLNGGHWQVKLSGHGRNRGFLVHRLVLEAFRGPCPPGWWGCHRDDDKDNNHLFNLRWDTPSEDMLDRGRNGIDPNLNKIQCPQGHPLTPHPYEPNRRWCHTCRLESNRRYRHKQSVRA